MYDCAVVYLIRSSQWVHCQLMCTGVIDEAVLIVCAVPIDRLAADCTQISVVDAVEQYIVILLLQHCNQFH